MYTSTTTSTSHPITTVSHVTTPVPSLHAGKAIYDRKLNVAIPLATLRVTMETSSTASNKFDDQQQQQQLFNQTDAEDSTNMSEESTKITDADYNHVETNTQNESNDAIESENNSETIEETTSVDRLKKYLDDLNNNENAENYALKTLFSLSDYRSLRSNDKKVIPQIDSDYSNTMHVLGETASIVSGDDAKIKTFDLRQTNRALY